MVARDMPTVVCNYVSILYTAASFSETFSGRDRKIIVRQRPAYHARGPSQRAVGETVFVSFDLPTTDSVSPTAVPHAGTTARKPTFPVNRSRAMTQDTSKWLEVGRAEQDSSVLRT